MFNTRLKKIRTKWFAQNKYIVVCVLSISKSPFRKRATIKNNENIMPIQCSIHNRIHCNRTKNRTVSIVDEKQQMQLQCGHQICLMHNVHCVSVNTQQTCLTLHYSVECAIDVLNTHSIHISIAIFLRIFACMLAKMGKSSQYQQQDSKMLVGALKFSAKVTGGKSLYARIKKRMFRQTIWIVKC